MFHKLYPFILLFLPKLYMSILAGCNNEIRPGGGRGGEGRGA